MLRVTMLVGLLALGLAATASGQTPVGVDLADKTIQIKRLDLDVLIPASKLNGLSEAQSLDVFAKALRQAEEGVKGVDCVRLTLGVAGNANSNPGPMLPPKAFDIFAAASDPPKTVGTPPKTPGTNTCSRTNCTKTCSGGSDDKHCTEKCDYVCTDNKTAMPMGDVGKGGGLSLRLPPCDLVALPGAGN